MKYALTLALMATGVALAQTELPPVTLDPRSWFTDVAALAAVVFGVTALVKGRFDLHDGWTLVVSYVSGVVIAVGFSFTSLFDATLGDAVVYGFSAATIASGGREGALVFLRKSFSWLSPFLPPQPVTGDAQVDPEATVPPHDSDLPPSRKG